ncbi:MAG: serine protease [Gammaproteobacteria bacterium]|nr:serine protease [Gammaproteobacteria bacterium]
MKRFLIFIYLALSVFSFPVYSKTGQDDNNPINIVLNSDNADKLLLVAFNDNTISSVVKGTASLTSYRNRGDAYQTSTWSESITDDLAEDYDLEKLAEWPMTEAGAHCVVYKIEDKNQMASTLDRLSKDKHVDIAQSMNVFKTKTSKEVSASDPYLKLQTNLQQMQIELAHTKATGRNITIGVIDIGVDIRHPDLTGQVSKNQNLVKDYSASFDADKHGTAVAGVIAARKDNSQGIIGVAPDAKIIALKACWPDKSDAMEAVCNSYSLALAVNTAIKMGVKVLNMSLTGPKDPILALMLQKAMEKGIIVVAADVGTGNAKENFPASMEGVISVQSTKPATAQDALTSAAIVAPGEKILTTLPYGTYDFISGSSIATAEVSGVIALLLELKPNLSGAEVRSILNKAKPATSDGAKSGVNASLAVNSLCEDNACTSSGLLSFAKVN